MNNDRTAMGSHSGVRGQSGVHKRGFSKGGFSNNNIMITHDYVYYCYFYYYHYYYHYHHYHYYYYYHYYY